MSANFDLAEWLPPGVVPAVGSHIVVTGPGRQTGYQPSVAGPAMTAPAMTAGTTAPPAPKIGDLWLDITIPASPDLKVWATPGGGGWLIMAKGAGLPKATARDQLLLAGAGPNFPWAPKASIDGGTY